LKIKRRYFAILFVVLAISSLSFASQDKLNGKETIKIISYNVEDGMSKDTTPGKTEFAAWLKAQDPDIVGFQELCGFTQSKLEALAAKYNNPYAILMHQGYYKVGITSKYPIVNVQIVNDNMSHGFIQAQINGYHIVVAHLDPHSYTQRRREIKIVLATIKASRQNSKEKWILMGDLNSVSPLDKSFYAVDDKRRQRIINDEKLHAYDQNLIDGVTIDYLVQQDVLDAGLVDSFHAIKDNELKSSETTGRIDYIYVSENLRHKIIAANFIRDAFTKTHSDHVPMCLVLRE
jgi:exodeoxyribonuclease III